MKILLNNQTLNNKLRPFNDVGFVPTMGGIHKGHISLIKRSIKTCNKTIRPFDDIGFVPTMGGIHEGHISLVKKSIKFSKKTLV